MYKTMEVSSPEDKPLQQDSQATQANSSAVGCQTFVLYKRRWLILALFSLISMTNEVIWISLSSITSIVKEYYQVSYIAVNWLSMVYMLFYVFVLLSAYVLTKQGLKFTIVVGTVLNGLGSCLRLIGSSRDGFVFAFLGNASAALAQCFILFVPPTLAAVWFGENERATASAIGVLMNMFGVAVGFLMGGMIVPSSTDYDGAVKQGMFNMLLSQALFCTILVILCVVLIKNAPKTPPTMSQALIRNAKAKSMQTKAAFKPKEGVQITDSATTTNCCGNETDTIPDMPKLALDDPLQIENIGFTKSLKILAKDKNFHLVTQAYGFYFGLFAAYNTVLNQMCTVYFPGEEKQIGLMGFASIILGLLGIFLAGIWIDKTKHYKIISVGTFVCCMLSMILFTLVLRYTSNMSAVFGTFCIFGFFSYPYMTVGLEHAAELTYPISEGTTSGILLLVGNMYGIMLTYAMGAIIDRGGSDVAGYIMAAAYGFGLLAVLFLKGELKRAQADSLRASLKQPEVTATA